MADGQPLGDEKGFLEGLLGAIQEGATRTFENLKADNKALKEGRIPRGLLDAVSRGFASATPVGRTAVGAPPILSGLAGKVGRQALRIAPKSVRQAFTNPENFLTDVEKTRFVLNAQATDDLIKAVVREASPRKQAVLFQQLDDATREINRLRQTGFNRAKQAGFNVP